MMKNIICIFVFLTLGIVPVKAQTDTLAIESKSPKLVHSVEMDIRPGLVLHTNEYLKGDSYTESVNRSLSIHAKWAFKFGSKTRLGQLYPHARQGIGVACNTFDGNGMLGTPVMLYAFQTSRIATVSPSLSLDYEWNFGASFGWKEYDPNDFSTNMVVGSDINAYINFGVMLNWQFARCWNMTAGLEFSHYSNGNTHMPNAGVNVLGARVGVVRTFGDERGNAVVPYVGTEHRGFILDVMAYGAKRKKMLDDGGSSETLVKGSFGIVGMNISPLYQFNKYLRAGVSADLQWDESANIADYLVYYETSGDMKFERPPFRKQFAVGLSARCEFVMPIFSINFGIGHNVLCSGKDTNIFYQTLNLKTNITKRLYLNVGYQLSKFNEPNNLMLGFGWRFGRNIQ